jgi:hypothetical protein
LLGSKLPKPRRASLFGYGAMVRIPLRSPTTDAAALPAFSPRQLPLVSWHFFLLALQVSVPISADHCLLPKAPECNALPAPSSFADTGLPSLLIFFCGSLSPEFLRPGRNPRKQPTSRLFGDRYGWVSVHGRWRCSWAHLVGVDAMTSAHEHTSIEISELPCDGKRLRTVVVVEFLPSTHAGVKAETFSYFSGEPIRARRHLSSVDPLPFLAAVAPQCLLTGLRQFPLEGCGLWKT